MKKAIVWLGFACVFAGCQNQPRVIDKLTYRVSENLETIRVSLVFDRGIQSNLGSGFTLKDYGFLFVNPYTETQPFEVGFDLNTAVLGDSDYLKLAPASVLPNGMPLGVPHPLVEVRAPQPVHPRFDIYGYVDVTQASWLGTGVVLTERDDRYFPQGLSINQILMRDDQGLPMVIASAAGPIQDSEGARLYPGVISLMANVRELIQRAVEEGGQGEVVPAEPLWFNVFFSN